MCTSPHPESSQSTVTTNPDLHFPDSCISISFTGHNTQQSTFYSREIYWTHTCSISTLTQYYMQINANQCAYKSDINTNTQEFQFGTLNLRPQHFHSHSIHKSVQRGNSLIQNYRIYESVTPPHNTMQQFHSKQTSSEYNEQTEIQTGNSTNIHNTYSFSPLGT